jgi:hypothetical protein
MVEGRVDRGDRAFLIQHQLGCRQGPGGIGGSDARHHCRGDVEVLSQCSENPDYLFELATETPPPPGNGHDALAVTDDEIGTAVPLKRRPPAAITIAGQLDRAGIKRQADGTIRMRRRTEIIDGRKNLDRDTAAIATEVSVSG